MMNTQQDNNELKNDERIASRRAQLRRDFGRSLEAIRERMGPEIDLKDGTHIYWGEGRYIVHAEDEPMISSSRHSEIGEAMQVAYDRVSVRLNQNGCGDGLVYDTYTDRIIAVIGTVRSTEIAGEWVVVVGSLPLPDEAEQARMKFIVRSWDDYFASREIKLPFIWETMSH